MPDRAARAQERAEGTQVIFGQRTTAGGTFFTPAEAEGGQNGSINPIGRIGI